jgi:hypothetical protein
VILEARAITETKRKEILRINLIPQVAAAVEVVEAIVVAVGAEAAVTVVVVEAVAAEVAVIVVVEEDVAVAGASAATELPMVRTRSSRQTLHSVSVFPRVELLKS